MKDILKGSPMYHMWYLYMLLGVYAMVPVILHFKSSISEKNFYKVSFIFLILASMSNWTSTVKLFWDIGQSFEYLGYFMVGYTIRKMCKKSSNSHACILIVIGVLFEICAAGLERKQIHNGWVGVIEAPYAPLIVPASILIFFGFTMLNIDINFTKYAGSTFWIYLIHAGVWDFIQNVFFISKGKNYLTNLDAGIWIICFTFSIFLISYYCSKLYLWVWNKIDKEKRITKFMLQMVHL